MTIATIISITGQAWARDASGDLRELRVGDTLQEGETLVTSDTGRVILDFADGLDPIVIGEGQEIAISADLDAEQPVTAEEASVQDEDLEALLAALEEGEGDLLEGLDATAAGAGGAGGPGGGHDFVRLARISENLDPLSFEYGLNSLGATFETQDQALDEAPDSIPTVATADLNGDGDVVWEAALSEGSGGGTLTTSGALQIDTGGDLLALIEVQNVNGTWIAITADGTEVSGEYGTLSVNTDGSWSYTLTQSADHPVAGESGEADQLQDLFGVRVTDDDGDVSDAATLTVDINDDGPVANADAVTQGQENAPVVVDVFANDVVGADGVDPATGVALVADSLTGAGNLVDNADGTFTYTPAAGEEGDVSFQYTITDGDGDTATATATLTLQGDSEPTVTVVRAEGDDGAVSESALTDGSGGGDLTASGTLVAQTGNDSLDVFEVQDVDGNWVAINADGTLVQGEYGQLAVDQDGSWTYTLSENTEDHTGVDATGAGDQVQDAFQVRATDSDGDVSDAATLTVDINDDGPVAKADAVTQGQENAPVVVDVFANDTAGADGVDPTTGVALVANSLTGSGNLVDNADGTFTYTPAAGEEGDVSFQYTITDGDGDSATATATITLQGDSEPQIQIDTDPSTAGIQGGDDSVAEAGLSGGSSDPNDASETTDGTFAIDAGNDSLAATNGLVIAAKDGASVDVTGGGTVQGNYGTLTVTLAGGVYSYSYTLDAAIDHGDTAPDSESFAVTVTDQDGDTASDTLTINIADDVPTAVDDSITPAVAEDTALQINTSTLIGNDAQGADGATVTGVSAASANGGTVSLSGGVVTYTPADGFQGSDSFSYTLTDGDGDTDTATVFLSVDADSTPAIQIDTDPSTAGIQGGDDSVAEAGLSGGSSDPNDASETTDGTFAIDAGNDSLAATNGLVIAAKDGASVDVTGGGTVQGNYGTLTVTLAGGVYSYSYTLDAAIDHGDTAPDSESFAVTVTDQDGDTASDTLTINIADDVPTAVDDSITPAVAEDTALQINTSTLIGNDAQGADGATVTGVSAASANGGTVSLSNGVVTYTPANGFEGADSFTYTITDGDGDPATATVFLSVEADSVPQVTATPLSVDEDDISSNGNAGGLGDLFSPSTTGTISYDLGSDTPPQNLKLSTSTSVFTTDGTAVDTIWDATNNVLIGYRSGGSAVNDRVFVITVTNIGDRSADTEVTLFEPLRHHLSTAADDTETDLFIDVDVTVVDQDGSTGSTSFSLLVDDDTPEFTNVADSDGNGVINLSAPNVDATYTQQLADWSYGADGESPGIDIANMSGNAEVVSASASQVVIDLKGADGGVTGRLTLNADGEDSLAVFARAPELTSDTLLTGDVSASGPALTKTIYSTISGLVVTVSASDGDAVPNEDKDDEVNPSTKGWAVADNQVDPGESLTFSFSSPVNAFEFATTGFTGGNDTDGLASLNIQVTYEDGFSSGSLSANPSENGKVVVQDLTGFDTNKAIQNITVTSAEPSGGDGFRLNNVSVGKFVSNEPPSLDYAFTLGGLTLTDGDGDSAEQAFQITLDGSATGSFSATPIALDLDNDGVEYLSRDVGVVFTDEVTGEAVNTAWLAGDDGLLVIDANQSGTVDESREYVFTEWSGTAETDMEAVAEVFDTNQNQMLDSGDEAWGQFAVWQDANSDGKTDEGEMVSLGDLGVESIALNYNDNSESRTDADGDVVVHGQSQVTWSDGDVTLAEDASFAIEIAELLPEATEELDAYFQASFDGTDTVVQVSKEGAFTGSSSDAEHVDQTITFEGVDMIGDLGAGAAIQALIDNGQLDIE